jgi:hypothetical protein
VAGAAVLAAAASQRGRNDEPVIPGTNWHPHDRDRPQPRIVAPAAAFSDNAPAPADAVVLFDGKDLSKWLAANGQPAGWQVDQTGGFMKTGRYNIHTKDRFADFQLHLEFATPAQVRGSDQSRGNSGVLINGMYEVQVLDNFNNKTYPDGQCGALYGQTPPLVNACKGPGQWQTYDIIFESPRWDADGNLVKKANVTVLQNGLVLHHKREFLGGTDGIAGQRALGGYSKQHPPEVTIELQEHGGEVRYRNIWIRPIGEYDKPLPTNPSSQVSNETKHHEAS